MKPILNQVILFDMDGTLLDSIPALAECCNRALLRHGLPQHPLAAYNKMVGWGMQKLIELACPSDLSEEELQAVMTTYDEVYSEECHRPGRIYPGLADLLRELRAQGFVTAVISNKPENQANALFHSTFETLLDTVWGHREGFPHKPDPTLSLELVRSLQGRLVAYVGDSPVDLTLGKNLGVPTIGVTWGTKTREEMLAADPDAILVDTPLELEKALQRYCCIP